MQFTNFFSLTKFIFIFFSELKNMWHRLLRRTLVRSVLC